MKVFYWIAFIILLTVAIPCVVYFGAYLASGQDRLRLIAVRFFRWSALVVLTTFNIAIFRHIILILIHW
ncbi:MAG TPA: hypothetical protein PLG77_06690 [Burkholderiaceae bacterium]|nr:hypothetical protein [Burkholderiaceae bacterium]